jgi:hypothetical protein
MKLKKGHVTDENSIQNDVVKDFNGVKTKVSFSFLENIGNYENVETIVQLEIEGEATDEKLSAFSHNVKLIAAALKKELVATHQKNISTFQ